MSTLLIIVRSVEEIVTRRDKLLNMCGLWDPFEGSDLDTGTWVTWAHYLIDCEVYLKVWSNRV